MATIRQLLSQSPADRVLDPESCLGWIAETNESYRTLNRPEMGGWEVVDVKLSTIFWRSRLLDRLLTQPAPWVRTRPDAMLHILTALNACLRPHQRRLAAGLLDAPGLARLMASQGVRTPGYPELAEQAGPDAKLNIVPNRGSSTTYEKWGGDERFSRYQFAHEGVSYRGISFRPGDVLLANVNLDGNGVYTSFSEPRGFSSHSGFFAMLDHDGRRLPVVIETYEKGVRPIPLSVFLGPRYCSYVEVYRHRDYKPVHAAAINRSASKYIDSVLGYNFDCEDQDPTYMACTSVGRFMLASAGLEPARRFSRLDHPQVKHNLIRIDYPYFDYFGPVDFLLNECFGFVGVVDNNQIEHLLARELIDRELLRQVRTYEINPDRFPFPYKLNRWGLGQMRRRTLIGKAVSLIQGFPAENLPRGPDAILAAILPVEKQIGKAIAKTRKTVVQLLGERDYLDPDAFFADRSIRSAIRRNLVLPWLQPDPDPAPSASRQVPQQND